MLITCKCLNIIVEMKEVEPRVNLKKELSIAYLEEFDNFFKENIQEVKIISAKKHVPAMIIEKKLGSWTVLCCLNCSINCYAVNLDNKTGLVNPIHIMSQDAVEHLQRNRDFSPAFNIIVQPVSEEALKSDLPQTGKRKNVLTSLQHQLREAIRNEVRKTEDSIRIFTEGLYEKLEDFQNRATKDHKALAHKLYEVQLPPEESSEESSNAEKESRKSDTKKITKCRKRKLKRSRAALLPTNESETQDRQTSSCPINAQPRASEEIPPSLDSEGLFYLEGMEDSGDDSSNSDEEDDNEEGEEEGEEEEEEEEEESEESESHDEGIDVQHEQTPSLHLARSLPVEIPPHPPHVYEDGDEVSTEGIDIAASIKALARSVRGDTVFGELPPPRLSTGI